MKKTFAVTNPPPRYGKLPITSLTAAPSSLGAHVQPRCVQFETGVTGGESKLCAPEHSKLCAPEHKEPRSEQMLVSTQHQFFCFLTA